MRFLLYSPDSFGLGHIRRTISISEQLLGDFHGSSALILTGAPRAHYFDFLDPCDAEPRRLMDEILQGLEKSRPPRGWGLDFSGLRNLSQTLQDATRGPAKRAS